MKPELTALLKQLKVADLKQGVPSISNTNAQFLADLILKHQFQAGLEIGTAHAYSTIHLACAFEQTGGHLTTIEHSPPSFNQAKLNLYRAKLESRVTQYLGRAQAVITESLTAQTYDFIFIDGIKKSTLEFFELCAPKLKSGGLIVVDDVIKYEAKMKDFYDFLNTQSEWKHEVHKLDDDDGIMVISRA